MAADPNAPYGYRHRDSDNDILRKILNWFNALGAQTKSIAVTVMPAPSDAGSAKISSFTKIVSNAGVPERLAATQGTSTGQQVIVVPIRTNTGQVFLDPDGTNNTAAVEAPFIFAAPDGKTIDPYDIYADVTVGGEGVQVVVIK